MRLFENFDEQRDLQPDLSGALFVNFCAGKSVGKIYKKAGTEGGNSCPKKKTSLLKIKSIWESFLSENQ